MVLIDLRSHDPIQITPNMRQLLFIILCLAALSSTAQKERERQAIHDICGCFQVDFRYAETFSPDTAYKFHPRYHTGGLELAYLEEEGPRKMVIQHLLLVDDSTVIKHWREDWTYETNDWWVFNHDAAWRHITLPADSVKGQWTQTVWEVNDAPRYQGASAWQTVDGKFTWQNTTDAPLPRREYTKRNDYNVLQRTNRIYPTDSGWVHEQDNRKLIRTDGSPDKLVAQEKGYNIYRRVPTTQCAAATAWWQAHRAYWNTVRAAWEETLQPRKSVLVSSKPVGGKYLMEELDAIEPDGNGISRDQVRKVIDKYLK